MGERAKPDPARARRVLVLAATLVMAGQLAVGLALDRAPLRVRFADADRVLEAASVRHPAPEVVLLGSSRTESSLDPELVEAALRERLGASAPPVASLAVDGGDLVASERILAELLARGVRPRLALIELAPEWLRRPVPFLNAQLVRAFDWSDVLHWLPEIVDERVAVLARARLFPVYHYRLELLSWWTGRAPPYLAAPRATPAPAKRRRRDDPAAGASRWARRLGRFETSARAEAVLGRILEICRAAGIECVLIVPPASAAQRAIYAGALDEAFRAALARAGTSDGSAPALVDERARLSEGDFRDSSHANHAGRERYSRIVALEEIAPSYSGTNTNAPP